MAIKDLSVKEVKALLAGQPAPEELAEIQADTRAGVKAAYKSYQARLKELNRVRAMYSYEEKYYRQGIELIAGVDEVGRGPLAGPVVIAAVILPPHYLLPKLNDSKKLSEATREKLYEEIMAHAVAVKVAVIDEATIDRVNIYQATINGMYQSVYGLEPAPQQVLVDAMPLENCDIPVESIIKGDSKSASIAAASIVAKVTRDRMMVEFDKQYPGYGFASNKGYGTAEHLAGLEKLGPCPIHRHSFEPIKSMWDFA